MGTSSASQSDAETQRSRTAKNKRKEKKPKQQRWIRLDSIHFQAERRVEIKQQQQQQQQQHQAASLGADSNNPTRNFRNVRTRPRETVQQWHHSNSKRNEQSARSNTISHATLMLKHSQFDWFRLFFFLSFTEMKKRAET